MTEQRARKVHDAMLDALRTFEVNLVGYTTLKYALQERGVHLSDREFRRLINGFYDSQLIKYIPYPHNYINIDRDKLNKYLSLVDKNVRRVVQLETQYLLAVADCLIKFHGAKEVLVEDMIKKYLERFDCPEEEIDLIYHIEPFDLACAITGKKMDMYEHMMEYLDLADGRGW